MSNNKNERCSASEATADIDSPLLVLNVDTGVDDAQGLLLAGLRTEARVLAVLCTAGNGTVQQACQNTLLVLASCGIKVPVYSGASCSLLGYQHEADVKHVHGSDGLGGVAGRLQEELDQAAAPQLRQKMEVEKESAAVALIRLADTHPGEITLVSTAPLTNLALALRLDPSLARKLKQIVIMGGNIEGRGRVSPCAEFNFYCDPEAAYVCMGEFQCPVTILPYEVCLKSHFSQVWFDEITRKQTVSARLVKLITEHAWHIMEEQGVEHYYVCDLLAVAIALRPSVVSSATHCYCTVELAGHHTRGQMVVDWNGLMAKSNNVRLVLGLDVNSIMEMYEHTLEE